MHLYFSLFTVVNENCALGRLLCHQCAGEIEIGKEGAREEQ